jgi:hypothetical protein
MTFFELSTPALAVILTAIIFGATGIGLLIGHRVKHLSESLREPFGVLQGAMLGVVGLILAFGLSLAVSRYEARRAAVVDDANSIGTTFLRAQTLREPVRTESLDALRDYTDTSIHLSAAIPGSDESLAVIAEGDELHRELWGLAGEAVNDAPVDTAPRLYVETLNEMIDMQTVRVAGLNNRVPGAVLALEVIGASLALALLATYLSLVGRGVAAVLLAAGLVTLLLLVTCDLDRPTRGLITVPSTPLTSLRATMALPPAAPAP